MVKLTMLDAKQRLKSVKARHPFIAMSWLALGFLMPPYRYYPVGAAVAWVSIPRHKARRRRNNRPADLRLC